MPFYENIDKYESLYLKDYAHFVFKNKLEDFVSAYLMNIHCFKIPLLQFFSHLTDEQLLTSAREGIIKLLTGIENRNAIEDVRENLIQWKQNSIPNIPREAISLNDITLIYSAQKISFQSFLPYYTADVSVAAQVINEIELFYKQVQEMALQMLEMIRNEEHEKRLESEEKYRDLFDNATDLIHISSPDGHILYVNNAWSETLGYKLEEIKGRLIFDFIKDAEVENFKKTRTKIINEGQKSIAIRTSFIKNTGEEVVVEGFIGCKYKDDTLEYTRALLHDVTSKLQQEIQIQFYLDQLAERERNLRDIIENAPDGVIVTDKENKIILWNPKAEEIFGWEKEEAAGKKIHDIIVPVAYREAHANGLKRFLATKQPKILNKTIELPALHKDGHEFYISLTVSHSTQNGKDIFIAFLRDISTQKKNEIELENKRKQLEKSNQELEQYAWLASHDLKEPLRKILTFSDALIKNNEKSTEKAFSYIQKIHASANRMKRLIEAVLSYSNVATDHDLFVETDLNEILAGVFDDIEITITSKNAIIESDTLPVIEAIPVQMTQLFQNLISNSIKYTRSDKAPEIRITCEREKEMFKISIKDNGIGFEKMYADKIFQVFQRLLPDKSYEGTGIGLALCKKIAETHRGSIYAESELGKGSTFVIYLPEKHPVSHQAT